jgi:hypothetical protein
MSGFILDDATEVLCAHGGEARAMAVSSRVRAGGHPILIPSSACVVSGCPLPVSAGGPCITAEWLTTATRVRSEGVPVLLDDSVVVCRPTGTRGRVAANQTRARAR